MQGASAWEYQWVAAVFIYHFLCRAFGQGVAIPKIVDLDVTNVITVLSVDLIVKRGRAGRGGLGGTRALGLSRLKSAGVYVRLLVWLAESKAKGRTGSIHRADRGHIDVVDALLGLDLSIDLCSSSCRGSSGVLESRSSRASRVTSDGTATASDFRGPVGG